MGPQKNRAAQVDTCLIPFVKRRRPARTALVIGVIASHFAFGSLGGALAQIEDSSAGSAGASAATGHAQVIAQAAMDMGDGEARWLVAADEIGKADTPLAMAEIGGFVVADDGAILLSNGAALTALAPGEAAVQRANDRITARSLGDGGTRSLRMALVPAAVEADENGVVTPAFTAGGLRDVDLVRDVLDEGERSALNTADVPTLVLVTEGGVAVGGRDGAEPLELLAGDSALVDGSLPIEATEDGTAFVAVVIGDEIEGEDAPAGGGGRMPASDGGAAASRPTSTSSSGSEDTAPPVDDIDGDGLDDNDEVFIYGTDPDLVDTDDDGLTDGEEVLTYDTDPLDADSDADGLSDGDEQLIHGSSPLHTDTDGDMLPDYNEVVQHNTDPSDPDTDEDGISDHDELGLSIDPTNADTDGDGLNDGAEITVHDTDPTVADTDNDGLTDYEEVLLYGTSSRSNDTDADLLPDYAEVKEHGTNPSDADTDDDGTTDYDEVSGGSDPNDPTSEPQV